MLPTIWSSDEFFKVGLEEFLNNGHELFSSPSHLLFIDLNHLPEKNTNLEGTKIDTIIFIIENNGDKYLLNKIETQCIEQFYKVWFILRKSSLSSFQKAITIMARTHKEDNITISNYTFTFCEKRILAMIADGFSVSTISNICQISPSTVSSYKRKIMRKINVNSSSVFFRKLIISRDVDQVLSILAEFPCCSMPMLIDK